MSEPNEDQKRKMYDGLSDEQKSKQTYTEWVKAGYANQYNKWMPWIEDKYLQWFGSDNKASYATKGKPFSAHSLALLSSSRAATLLRTSRANILL